MSTSAACSIFRLAACPSASMSRDPEDWTVEAFKAYIDMSLSRLTPRLHMAHLDVLWVIAEPAPSRCGHTRRAVGVQDNVCGT